MTPELALQPAEALPLVDSQLCVTYVGSIVFSQCLMILRNKIFNLYSKAFEQAFVLPLSASTVLMRSCSRIVCVSRKSTLRCFHHPGVNVFVVLFHTLPDFMLPGTLLRSTGRLECTRTPGPFLPSTTCPIR